DGIRDFHVTGVQTCALPILTTPWPLPGAGDPPLLGIQIVAVVEPVGFLQALPEALAFGVRVIPRMVSGFVSGFAGAITGSGSARSEERRVGEEWRARWGACG